MTGKIGIGYEIPSGEPVSIDRSHLIVTGLTQESGKTTTLEKIVKQSVESHESKALVFLTKQDETGFKGQGNAVAPYFKDKVDWEYVVQILETAMKKSMDFKEPWIIKAVQGDYPDIKPADTLQGVWDNIQTLLDNHRDTENSFKLRGMEADVYVSLNAYFEKVVPKIKEANLATELELQKGLNVMDLRHLDREVQALIIGRTTQKVYEDEKNAIEIMPEAWKFLPQSGGSPCKDPVETFVREAAGKDDFLLIDSQDITGVDKQPIKQVKNWILGFQSEKNEVERTRKQMPMPTRQAPGKEEIMQLRIGEFFYCSKSEVKKVYIAPVWIDEIEIEVTQEMVEEAEETLEKLKEEKEEDQQVQNLEMEINVGETYSGQDLAKMIAKRQIHSKHVKDARKAMLDEVEKRDELDSKLVEEEATNNDEDKDKKELKKKLISLEERIETLKQQIDNYEELIEEKDSKIEELQSKEEKEESSSDTVESPLADKSSGIKEKIIGGDSEEDGSEQSEESGMSEKQLEKLKESMLEMEDVKDEITEIVKLYTDELATEEYVDKQVEEIKASSNEPDKVESVQDQILQNFQEKAIKRLMEEIGELNSNQKDLVLFIESKGSNVSSKKALVKGALGWESTGGVINDNIDELVDNGFIRQDNSYNYYPNTKQMVEEELEGYNSDEEVIEDTYQKLLAKISDSSNK